MPYRTALTRDFIVSKSVPNPNGCWIWALKLDPRGYGHIGVNPNGERFAHRLSYTLFNGPIPEGMSVDHICWQTDCVNPEHLQLLTIGENSHRKEPAEHKAARLATAGERPKLRRSPNQHAGITHCKRGHEFDTANTIITPDGRRNCRACKAMYAARRKARQANAR